MGLKALFSKEGRRERALQKACAKAVNSKLKPEDRRPALELLLDEATPEAITALLGRFGFNYDTNMVSDEEEKSLVYHGLLDLGERILEPLRAHLRTAPSLSWGLRLVEEICEPSSVWTVVEELATTMEPGYDRDPTRKQQLLTFVGNLDDPRAVDVLLPYLEDHDETVRFITVEGLFRHGDERAREPLLKVLVDEDEESLRIKNRIAEGFAEKGWTVKGYRGSVEKMLPEEYVVDGKGRIRPKKAKK